jgi:hypothetical protein
MDDSRQNQLLGMFVLGLPSHSGIKKEAAMYALKVIARKEKVL